MQMPAGRGLWGAIHPPGYPPHVEDMEITHKLCELSMKSIQGCRLMLGSCLAVVNGSWGLDAFSEFTGQDWLGGKMVEKWDWPVI